MELIIPILCHVGPVSHLFLSSTRTSARCSSMPLFSTDWFDFILNCLQLGQNLSHFLLGALEAHECLVYMH
jgi:hypothetical protein